MRLSCNCILPQLLLAAIVPSATSFAPHVRLRRHPSFAGSPLFSSGSGTKESNDAAFSAFAESLDEDSLFEEEEKNDSAMPSWKDSLDAFLDPLTPLPKRQILLSELLGANAEIRESVQSALKERKIDPILTPRGKRIQDGARAVARQVTTDILPQIAEAASTPPAQRRSKNKPSLSTEDLPTLLPKIGSRVLDATSKQVRKQLENLSEDLANPTRIPERLSKQTAELAQEARNIFLETPEGLIGPDYTVVEKSEGYEIREYEGFNAAAASMSKLDEAYSMDDIASSGAAFNALAAYIFGANEDGASMEMTTPVATTNDGEMWFYLARGPEESIPAPLDDNPSGAFGERGEVKIIDVEPARLAVKRFSGFVTAGEVARQKDALLSELAVDGVEIDVPHGAVVPHVILQYNPPYTIPVIRRNEIGVPVLKLEEGEDKDLEKEWENNNGPATSDDA